MSTQTKARPAAKPKNWILRGCPHCGGDLHLDESNNLRYTELYLVYVCLQCSRRYGYSP